MKDPKPKMKFFGIEYQQMKRPIVCWVLYAEGRGTCMTWLKKRGVNQDSMYRWKFVKMDREEIRSHFLSTTFEKNVVVVGNNGKTIRNAKVNISK